MTFCCAWEYLLYGITDRITTKNLKNAETPEYNFKNTGILYYSLNFNLEDIYFVSCDQEELQLRKCTALFIDF